MMVIRQEQINGLATAAPGTKMITPCSDTKTWVEVRLLDDHDEPIARAKYRLVLPDSSIFKGELDDDGRVRIEGIVPGECEVTFPELNKLQLKPV